jgi:hypothetical protein
MGKSGFFFDFNEGSGCRIPTQGLAGECHSDCRKTAGSEGHIGDMRPGYFETVLSMAGLEIGRLRASVRVVFSKDWAWIADI